MAALVVTGPVGLGIGIGGAVAGGLISAHNLQRRWSADRLHWDFQTAMDVLGVVGAFVALGGLRSLGTAGHATAELDEAMAANLAKRAKADNGVLHILGSGVMAGQVILIPLDTTTSSTRSTPSRPTTRTPTAAATAPGACRCCSARSRAARCRCAWPSWGPTPISAGTRCGPRPSGSRGCPKVAHRRRRTRPTRRRRTHRYGAAAPRARPRHPAAPRHPVTRRPAAPRPSGPRSCPGAGAAGRGRPPGGERTIHAPVEPRAIRPEALAKHVTDALGGHGNVPLEDRVGSSTTR